MRTTNFLMDEDEFKSELDMGKRGGGQMLTIIEFPILNYTYT